MISNALSLMIAIPLLGALISFFAGSKAKFVALLASLAPLYLSLQMYMEFDKTSKIMQFVESYDWVPSIGVKYTLGVDGIGFPTGSPLDHSLGIGDNLLLGRDKEAQSVLRPASAQ